jgi:hypothetical protein
VKNGLKSCGFLADLTNSAWRILADFYIRSGGFEKNHLATLDHEIKGREDLRSGGNKANWHCPSAQAKARR